MRIVWTIAAPVFEKEATNVLPFMFFAANVCLSHTGAGFGWRGMFCVLWLCLKLLGDGLWL